jgi:hypothetical protein
LRPKDYTAYTLDIRLAEIEPPIWRRIVVPGQLTLFQLHQVFQVVMGWYHSHLHQFVVEKNGTTVSYGEPSPEDDYYAKDERRVALAQIAPKQGATFQYEYDFGDSWQHLIRVEDIEPSTTDDYPYLWCLSGARAAPPEDVGGVSGYIRFLEAWRNRNDEEHRQMRQWVGKHYKPELFSVRQVNSALALWISMYTRPSG